jgi:endoglucanase
MSVTHQEPNEHTLLIPRQTRELSRAKMQTLRCVKWISIAFAACGITVVYLYIYLGFGRSLVDQRLLAPRPGIRLNTSIPTTPEFQPPFRSEGRQILDALNTSVRLKSVNWYGASDVYFIPSGLDVRHRDEISNLIRSMGFNSVRLPYSDEMVLSNMVIPAEHLTANPDLIGHRALDVYTAVVQSLTTAGLLVVINNHITQATWCCGINPCDASWANDWLGPFCRVRQTESSWIENWERVMRPIVRNPLVIGVDLRNEVRGLWGTMRWKSWAEAAERAAETLLRMNQNWLIIVEGTSSATDLSGVRKRPVRLSIPGRVVYSVHVYCWSGWGELAPYSETRYDSFAAAMRRNWAYLVEEDIAAVWVGEFGTPDRPTSGDLNYWKHLVQFLADLDAQWGYWAINPRKPANNKAEGYGLVQDDWETLRWDYRMQDLLELGLNVSRLEDMTV